MVLVHERPSGCRRISESIEMAGFTLDQLVTYYFKGEPKPFAVRTKAERRSGAESQTRPRKKK
jgi:hypothetical protein